MEIEKEIFRERRRTPTKPFGRYALRGRRMRSWRESDANYYVDRYETKYFALICAVLLLGVLDAYFTIRILHMGGSEINALMRPLLDRKPALAIVAKYLSLAGSIIIILVHKNYIIFGRLKVRHLLLAVLVLYGLLVLYEAHVVLTYVRLAGPPA